MSWHWESYVHKNNLWYHFKRFSEAIKGIEPIQEAFVPSKVETNALRVYLLKGRKTNLLWVRDKSNNWESELGKGMKPQLLHGIRLNLMDMGLSGPFEKIQVYDPWEDSWKMIEKDELNVTLPDFRRSVVVRLTSK